MSYTDSLNDLADEAANTAEVAWSMYVREVIDADTMIRFLVAQVAAQNAVAQSLAIQSVAATISSLLGTIVPPAGVTKGDETQRLVIALHTLTQRAGDDKQNGLMRVRRLASAEVYDSAQWAFGEALEATAKSQSADWKASEAAEGEFPAPSKRVRIGWRRGLMPGACQLCEWLEKDGYVYPPERKMHHHTGCRCQQIIVVSRTSRDDTNTIRTKARRGDREAKQELAAIRSDEQTYLGASHA